jgi:predicted esterase
MDGDPHANQPLLHRGPEAARGVLVMVHGRGATAQSILSLYDELAEKSVAAVAPQAAGGTWYPHSFLAPTEMNQPYLDSALGRLASVVKQLLGSGLKSRRIGLLGFSQGACLVSEFVARHPQPYGAVMALSGGLIGPEGTKRNYAGSLGGVRVFLGSSDPDAHVPFSRVEETGKVLERMGAAVDVRRYPGMGHTINQDELEACRLLVKELGRDQG